MALSDFRQAVQTALQTALSIRFYAGEFAGPFAEGDAGCVWVRGKREWGDDVNVEEVLLGVRVFEQWKQQEGGDSPDAAALEVKLEQLQTTLKAISTTAGPWFFRVTELEILYDQSAVEATLLAYQDNLAV